MSGHLPPPPPLLSSAPLSFLTTCCMVSSSNPPTSFSNSLNRTPDTTHVEASLSPRNTSPRNSGENTSPRRPSAAQHPNKAGSVFDNKALPYSKAHAAAQTSPAVRPPTNPLPQSFQFKIETFFEAPQPSRHPPLPPSYLRFCFPSRFKSPQTNSLDFASLPDFA